MENILLSSKPIEIADYKTYKEATFIISVLDEWDENNRLIPKDVGEKYHKTIIGFPIVAKLIRDVDGNPVDFRGHEMKVIVNSDGTTDYKFDTMPIGSVLDSWIEKREVAGYKGKKDCIMIKAKLWSDRFPEYFTVLDKLWANNDVKSSWELVAQKTEKTIKGKIIKAFSFLGNCILGSTIAPAVSGAGVVEYAQSENDDKSNDEFVLASALSKDCLESSYAENSVKEENMSKSKKEEVVVEATSEIAETVEETVEETVVETPIENAENVDNDNKEEEVAQEQPTVDETEVSAITVNDLRKKLQESVAKATKYGWVCYVFPTESYCLVRDDSIEDELSYLKFTYTVDGDDIVLGEPEEVKLVVSVAEINSEIAAKNDALVVANEKILELEKEVAELSTYKEQIAQLEVEKAEKELAEKRESLKQYALKSNRITEEELGEGENANAEIKRMISELDEVGIKALISDRLIASLSEETKVDVAESSKKQIKADIRVKSDLFDDEVVDAKSIVRNFLRK